MGLSRQITETELKAIQCGTCGIWHAIPLILFDTCYSEGGFWHCPNGHQRGYSKGNLHTQLEQKEKELQREKQRREWAEQNLEEARKATNTAEARRVAQKAATTRLANRAKAGICPCCNRTFKQLAAHMKNKHADYKAEEI